MTCKTCNHCQRKLQYLGWRLWCRLYKRNVGPLERCIDWGKK